MGQDLDPPLPPPTSLDAHRAIANGDPKMWSPVTMLKHLIQEIESGLVEPEKMIVHWFTKDNGKDQGHGFAISNTTFTEHIALLEIAKVHALEDWMSD